VHRNLAAEFGVAAEQLPDLVSRLLATRKAAAYYTKSAGHPPKRLRKVT